MHNNRTLGAFYEEQAVKFLEEQGLRILERNFRCKNGEIDIIAAEGKTRVFVEVKYRFSWSAGSAASAVTPAKQKIISRVASYYLYTKVHSFEVPCRFDVIAFEGEEPHWYKNAFDYIH